MSLMRLIRDDRGSSAVEFGFITPLLFVMTLGMIDIGRLGLASTTIQFAVADAARFAVAHGPASVDPKTDADVEAFALNALIGVATADVTITITRENGLALAGNKVTVAAAHSVGLFISSFMPWIDPVPVDRASTMTMF